ncbi:MAG: tRNA pseudouridine(55) synthase TruB [Kiritimatiellae bacterium]|nr:tRNA pseudouridine(55) synthase TruB [Kiritimatiellia bacterium]
MANLTQLKMLEDLNGVLLVDKPAGLAFPTVVKTVKRKFNLVKVGHGGSLDAMASGLLILLVNDANRFVGDVMGADRRWTGTMRLGRATNTHDCHGEVVAERDPSVTAEGVEAALAAFRGDIFQTEPRYCSVRREGSAAYETADTGEHSQFLAHVYRFSAGPAEGGLMPFEVDGTKSLLVRTLVNDFGAELGCGACLESLRRTRVGKFDVSGAIPFDRLLETGMGDFASCVKPMSAFLR